MILIPNYAFGLVIGDVYTDDIGYTHYNFNDGTTGTSHTDITGTTYYNLDNGTFGSSYTDSIGHTQYFFDSNYYNAQEKNSVSRCNISYKSFTCLTEENYQNIYNNAVQGLPSCNNNVGRERGSFIVPAEQCTPEGREKLIMNGTYGSILKMCREHIEAYKVALSSYDECIQRENKKREEYVRAKLSLLKMRADAELDYLKFVEDYKNKQISCPDDYWVENNKCMTCSDVNGEYSYAKKKTNGEYVCACKFGYGWNSEITECIPADMVCKEKYGIGAESNNTFDGCKCKIYFKLNPEGTKCIDNWNNVWNYVIKNFDDAKNYGNKADNKIDNKKIIIEEKEAITKIDSNLSKRMSGNILLQVEKNGEGWYVFPDNQKKYYLGRPADAFSIMRKLGLGATHKFITENTIFPDHVLGKILLDVEQNGEAYYIYPKDRKAYYLGRPADAFSVMRNLGLGITNSDVRKIAVGEVE